MTDIRPTLLRRFLRARALYPTLLAYLLTVGVVMAITRGWLTVAGGIVVLGVVSILDVLEQMRREVTVVHELVNSEHTQLVARVDQLIEALDRLGAVVPPNPRGGA